MRQVAAQQHGTGLRQPHKVVVAGVWPGVASAWGCSSDDVVYSNLFTGVHGNYLKPSIRAAGLDPDALPESDATAMNFGSTRKPWKEIWGCGQGIAAVRSVEPVAMRVERLAREYE